MTTVAIRKKLHQYIADAEDNKVKGMFMLLEDEIIKKESFELKESHLQILEEERMNYANGKSKSYSWEDAKRIIRGEIKID